MKNTHIRKGFTLVELLVVIALMGIFLGMISAALNQSGSYTRLVATKAETTDDIRVAGQMMADQLANAVYVYPPKTSVTLNSTTSWTVRKSTGTPNNRWEVGDARDPIIAFVAAPRLRTGPLAPTRCSNVTPEYCLYFVAYYVIQRNIATTNSTLYGPADTNNPDARMIFEYRARLPFEQLVDKSTYDALPVPNTTLPNPEREKCYQATPDLVLKTTALSIATCGFPTAPLLTNISGNFLADYVKYTTVGNVTSGFTFTAKACRNGSGELVNNLGVAISFVDNTDPINPINVPNNYGGVACPNGSSAPLDRDSNLSSLTQAVLDITASYKDRGNKIVETATMSFPIAPRNLYTAKNFNLN